MTSKANYAVVEFISGRSVDIIPINWLCSEEEDECFWPSQKASIYRMVKSKEPPQDSWSRHKIRILGKAGTYERAREKLTLAEDTSDLQTDAENEPRKRRRTSRLVSSESDSSDVDSPAKSSNGRQGATVQGSSLARSSVPPPPQTPCHSRSNTTSLHSPPLPPSATPSTTPSTTTNTNTTLPVATTSTPSPRNESAIPRQSHDRVFMQKVLTILEDMRETQRIHGGLLKSLLQKGRVEHENFSLPDGVSFPLKTGADLHATEVKLADPAFQTGLENYLSDLGGRTLQEATKRMMAYLIENALALNMNFIGRNNKTAFGKTKLFEVVNKALKKNTSTSSCNRQEAEKAVSKWLSGARDRDGNRNIRRQRQEQPQE